MPAGISIVIPSWNGMDLLRENLPSVLAGARRFREETGGCAEVLVVDDGSTDSTRQDLPREFPDVRIQPRERNGGFARACNTGFSHCNLDLIALLNNDVRIQEDYLLHKSAHFDDPDVFAVTARVFEWDAPAFATGGRFGNFRRGFWSVYFNYDICLPEAADWIKEGRLLSFYAIGGFATFDRRKLNELGGFLPLLSPFHWEDVDLSYRGWKRGWRILYEPRSIARHRVSATINSHFRERDVEMLSLRNRLIFHWVNLHSPSFLARHLLALVLLMLTRWMTLDFDFYRSLRSALKELGPALELRKREKRQARRTDRELNGLLKRFYRSAPIQIYYSGKQVADQHTGLPREHPHTSTDPVS